MTKHRTNILICSAGRRVELLRAFEAAARERGAGKVYCADAVPGLSAACAAAAASAELPRIDDPGYGQALTALCDTFQIGMVVPTIDTELPLLAKLAPELAQQGCEIIISSPVFVDACMDKRWTAALFAKINVPTPALYEKGALLYPCFSKPARGSSGVGAVALMTAKDLRPGYLDDTERMFMELVPADWAEITVDLLYDRYSNLRCAVPRQRIEIRAGEVSKGKTRRDWIHDFVWTRFATLAGARGCITLQLFADDKSRDIRAIEVNARFGGGYPLAYAAGADFPGALIGEVLFDEPIERCCAWETGLTMLRYDAHVLVQSGQR